MVAPLGGEELPHDRAVEDRRLREGLTAARVRDEAAILRDEEHPHRRRDGARDVAPYRLYEGDLLQDAEQLAAALHRRGYGDGQDSLGPEREGTAEERRARRGRRGRRALLDEQLGVPVELTLECVAEDELWGDRDRTASRERLVANENDRLVEELGEVARGAAREQPDRLAESHGLTAVLLDERVEARGGGRGEQELLLLLLDGDRLAGLAQGQEGEQADRCDGDEQDDAEQHEKERHARTPPAHVGESTLAPFVRPLHLACLAPERVAGTHNGPLAHHVRI